MRIKIILVCLFQISLFASESKRFRDTAFYSTPLEGIELENISVKEKEDIEKPLFTREGRDLYSLKLNPEQMEYYKSLSDEQKKTVVKIASLGIYDEEVSISNYVPEQYSLIYKQDGAFNLETIAIVPMSYKNALPIIRDFSSYNDWVLNDINVRRDGRGGRYFLDIDSIRTLEKSDGLYLASKITLRRFFRGSYRVNLKIYDETDRRPVPYFKLKMQEPTALARHVEGEFRFIILPGLPYFVTYFTGRTELNWKYYRLLPIRIVRSQVVERIYTLLENVHYKAEEQKQLASSKKLKDE